METELDSMGLLEDAVPESVLERAKTRRRYRDLGGGWHDIPSWGGELKAYYAVLERDDVEEMVKRARARAQSKGRRGGNAAGQRVKQEGASDADLDFIIKACTNTKAVDTITEEEQVLDLTYNDIDAWKEKLKVDTSDLDPNDPDDADEVENQRRLETVKTPREMCAYLMGYNAIAIAAHAGKLANWMQDTSKNEDPT